MLRFQPLYKQVPWGGSRFAHDFARRVPEGPLGEAWELVEIDGHESQVARGSHEGRGLGELWRGGKLGGSAKGAFPFLLKWLDCQKPLSIQVHPDEAACRQLGHGAPKSEAWYVADAAPNATLLVGHHKGLDAAILRTAATGGTVPKWLYELRPRLGDMINIPAGTLHAIGGGFLLLEVQQPSDSTFRVYDWGRTDPQGKPRPLHVDEACAAVRYDRPGAPKPERERLQGPCFAMRGLRSGAEIADGPLRVFVADRSSAIVATERGEEPLDYGDVVVAEPADGVVRLVSGTVLYVTETA